MKKDQLNGIATRGVEALFAEEPPVYNGARDYPVYENDVRTDKIGGVRVSAAYLGGELPVKLPGKSMSDLGKLVKGKTRIAFDGLRCSVWISEQKFSELSLTADEIREVK